MSSLNERQRNPNHDKAHNVQEVVEMNKEKKKGLFDFLKKPKSGCCDMEIIEVGKEKKVKKVCCEV